ncbi:MAG: hypothetical protein FWH51_03040 [Dehalococcoidia bacterium]|nr:hypothetical protein [Dehalococcoidia bacterium]
MSLINLPCPICGGCGEVGITPGIENVHVMRVSGSQVTSVANVCEMSTVFQYEMDVRLTNTGFEDVDGWLKLVLRDFTQGAMLDRQYVNVRIPAETTVDFNFRVWFRTGFEIPLTIEVHVEPVTDTITDEVCGGNGRLPFNMWLMANNLKDTLNEKSQKQQEFIPPAPFFPLDSWAE